MTPVLIAGPTASGKSGVALALARAGGGVVVNADSQQVYDSWRVLTARPSAPEEAAAPHRLYGHVPVAALYSVGAWLRDLAPVLAACHDRGQVAIIVGGTGLYFRALTRGLAEIPVPGPEWRIESEAWLARHGADALAAELAAADPASAARVDMANPRRVQRAWEVLHATGRGIAAWQDATPPPLLPLSQTRPVLIAPDRDWLYDRCNRRFDQMLDEGALDEARQVHARALDPALPGLHPVGAPALFAHLAGEITLDEAAARAKQETRRYAKRQLTWGRNQMADWPRAVTPEDALARLSS